MTVNVLHDPRLIVPALYLQNACAMSRLHSELAAHALATYGDHGPAISGCVRDHFPSAVKDDLRRYARDVAYWSNKARAARPSRVRRSTINKLARAIAKRDGSGFYGPQP